MDKGWTTISIEEFAKRWNGVAILVAANENSGEKDYALNRQKEFVNNLRLPFIMVSSPFCGHCTPAFNALEKLISEFPEGVKVLVRIMDGGKREVTKQLISLADQPELAEKALHAWYIQKKKDAEGWLQQFATTEPVAPEIIDQRLDEIANWCKANEIRGTPSFFINGRKMPNTLKITDLKYFLRALFEEAEENPK